MNEAPAEPIWGTDHGRGLHLVDAGPRMWLPLEMLQDLLDSMPLFPTALVSTDFSGCVHGHYVPGPASTGAVIRFRLNDGRHLVYRIVRYDFMRRSYELVWPD